MAKKNLSPVESFQRIKKESEIDKILANPYSASAVPEQELGIYISSMEVIFTNISGEDIGEGCHRFFMTYGKYKLKRIKDTRENLHSWVMLADGDEMIIMNKKLDGILEEKWNRETAGKTIVLEDKRIKWL